MTFPLALNGRHIFKVVVISLRFTAFSGPSTAKVQANTHVMQTSEPIHGTDLDGIPPPLFQEKLKYCECWSFYFSFLPFLVEMEGQETGGGL